MVSRWFRFTVVTGLCGVAIMLASADAASAKLAHVYTTSFKGSGASALSEPAGIAVNNQTGNVYVVDKGHDRVEEFDSSGAVIGEFNGEGSPTGAFSAPEAIAVDNSTDPLDPSAGDVYVTDTGHRVIDKFSASGTYLGQIAAGAGNEPFGELYGVAVDTEGKLWVYQGSGEIDDYSDALENTFIATREDPRGTNPAFAVDSEDNLYVKTGAGNLAKLSSNGSELEEEVEGPEISSQGVAVNASNGYVYFDTSSAISILNDADHEVLESFGSGHLTAGEGVAVNTASNTVYVADSAGSDVAVFAIGTLADGTVEAVSSFPSTSSATLKGTVSPDGTTVTGCEFEYGVEPGEFTGKAACSPAPPLGGEHVVAVSATATGLTQGVTYHYRLTATNENGSGSSPEGKFLMPETLKVESESVSLVEAKSTMLQATVNPGGSEGRYHFEYGVTAGSYEVSVPIPDGGIAASSSGVRVSALAVHLVPGTTYHYRVVASNGLPGAVAGPDQTFTTLVAEGSGLPAGCANEQRRGEQLYALPLPDCRAYEMVSPLEKNGNEIGVGETRASVAGGAVTYESAGSFGEARGAELQSRYVSRRGLDGWATKNITPRLMPGQPDVFTAFERLEFNAELTKGVLRSHETSLTGTPEGYSNLYVADLEAGTYEDATPVAPEGVTAYEGFNAPTPRGTSGDLSRVYFGQRGRVTPDANAEVPNAYEWFGGHLYFVGYRPDGTPVKGGSAIGAVAGFRWHAVSSDGLRAFFGAEREVYLRENPERSQSPVQAGTCTVAADACTVAVSASQRQPLDSASTQLEARFQGASVDGSRVFFTSASELTNDAYTGPADNAANLYEYDVETGALRDLTVDGQDAEGAAVLGFVGAAEDGSYAYFVATGGKLASNRNSNNEAAVSGKPNLYAYHEGQVTFIATLAAGGAEGEDAPDWNSTTGPPADTVRTSADGMRLAFESRRSLTGYENQQAEPGECESRGEGGHCREVFLYDAVNGRLVCASCDPSGARPIGPAELGGKGGGESAAGRARESTALLAEESSTYGQRNLSASGDRLFFETPDALVRRDTNGREDVYEYEEGHVQPLSDVTGHYGSYFMDASASGDDVFIATADRLVAGDGDGMIDVYDVRVNGGFQAPTVAVECDNGDACRAPISPQPRAFSSPASATFSGSGNIAAPGAVHKAKTRAKPKIRRCSSGFRKRHGRCVRSNVKRSHKLGGPGKRSKRRGK